jgi:hypothetical protein
MDQSVLSQLAAAGLDATMKEFLLSIPILLESPGVADPISSPVMVSDGTRMAPVDLKPIAQLYEGRKAPPDFKLGPTPEYKMFFLLIEVTARDYCKATGSIQTDQEFERLFRLLNRRPDGKDSNPLFSYLQALVRLYMSINPVSEAEFLAVSERLRVSARTFGHGSFSRNYWDVALYQLDPRAGRYEPCE